MDHSNGGGSRGILVIGAFKLLTGLLLLGVGVGLLRLLNKDVAEALERFVAMLRLDPDNRYIQTAISWAARLDRKHLKAIGVGTFVYAALYLIEGIGLLMRRRWAEYLTVIATGSLIPLEGYELVKKVTAARVVALVLNVAIVIYLIVNLWRERRARADRPGEPAAAPAPAPTRP